jgi:hypothetical protein
VLTWPQEAFLQGLLRELLDESDLWGDPSLSRSEAALAQRILAKCDAAEVASIGAFGLPLIQVSPQRRLPERAVSHAD